MESGKHNNRKLRPSPAIGQMSTKCAEVRHIDNRLEPIQESRQGWPASISQQVGDSIVKIFVMMR